MNLTDNLVKKYNFKAHTENGLYVEQHYQSEGHERPLSGLIYFYVRPGERTQFHHIDCDEYWSYNAGSVLEIWVIGLDGQLKIKHCGIEDGAEPTIRVAAGEIFASKLSPDMPDGTFVTCITVPRFSYDGFQMYEKEEIIKLYPETLCFWDNN